jgi:DNA-binding CsgD family transcriptional regulator
MAGYLNREADTRKRLIDGWYDTGDVMRRDENGFVFFVGRADDMFQCGGENVYPGEVEKLLELTPREREILELLAEGLRVKQIAERLSLSPATVHTHVRNAIARMEVDTRTEAVALAVRFSYLGAGGSV